MSRQDFRIGKPRRRPTPSANNKDDNLILSRETRGIQSPGWIILVVCHPLVCLMHHTVRNSRLEGDQAITLVDTHGYRNSTKSDTRCTVALIRCLLSLLSLLSLDQSEYLHQSRRNDDSNKCRLSKSASGSISGSGMRDSG